MKWLPYLPEYRNIDAGDKYSCIEVRLDVQTGEDEPYKVYFANYDESGKTDNNDNAGAFSTSRAIISTVSQVTVTTTSSR